jgi:hypothetical protein
MRDGFHIRNGIFGTQVLKPAQNLPQNATATLATVVGGLIAITSFAGYVTQVIGATAMNMSIGTAPTIGVTNTGAICAPTPFASTPVGSWLAPVQSAGIAGQIAIGAGGAVVFMMTYLVVSAGMITWTTTAANTGQVKWYFTYVPLDETAALK